MPDEEDENPTELRDIYDSISPVDYRYWSEGVAYHLSENGYTRYKLAAEVALVEALQRRGLCSEAVVREIKAAVLKVTTAAVYAEEKKKTKHDLRALVNRVRAGVSDEAKPFVHMMATSYDVSDTANAARFKAVTKGVLVPALRELESALIEISLREAGTKQIGRTHGQHAVPITFGFATASYVSRLGGCIQAIDASADGLRGKFSGAVGAYNASSIFFDDPEAFEREILAELGLEPAEHSSQIVPPEAMTRFLSEVVMAAGVIANLADDMRNLQRTEIGEVGEEFEIYQVGSSTMAQKRNPINFENGKACWKIVMPRLITVYMDQISEHQRDLTNSASGRTYGEIIAYVVSTAKKLTRTMKKLKVDPTNLKKNLEMQGGLVVAEPIYIMIASMGHPDAHEAVKLLTLKAQAEHRSLQDVIAADEGLKPYLARMTPKQLDIIAHPDQYIGIAPRKAMATAEAWRKRLAL